MILFRRIAYCQELAESFGSENLPGRNVNYYFTHGHDANQIQHLSEWMNSLGRVLITTNCTAQGVDCADVSVIVAYMCEEVNVLAQMCGRAGRGGQVRHAFLLCSEEI